MRAAEMERGTPGLDQLLAHDQYIPLQCIQKLVVGAADQGIKQRSVTVTAHHRQVDAVILDIVGQQRFGRSKSGDRFDNLPEGGEMEAALLQKLAQFRFFF